MTIEQLFELDDELPIGQRDRGLCSKRFPPILIGWRERDDIPGLAVFGVNHCSTP